MNHVTRIMLVTAGILPASYGLYFAGSAALFVWDRQSSGRYDPKWPVGAAAYQEARHLAMEQLGVMRSIGSVEVRGNSRIEFNTAVWSPYTASSRAGGTISVERKNGRWQITPPADDWLNILTE